MNAELNKTFSQPKKVLHVVNIAFVLPYFIGEQFAFFKQKGVIFHVACSPSAFFDQYITEEKLFGHPIPILRSVNPFVDLISIYKLYRLIKSEKIDVVIGHTPKGGLLAMTASLLAGVSQRIYFRHGLMYETSIGFRRKLLKAIESITGLMAKKVVCVSPSVLAVSEMEKLSPPKKNILLHKGTCNGINLQHFSKAALTPAVTLSLRNKYNIGQTDRVFGYVGRLVNDKGIRELIEAWQLLLKEFTQIKLLLIGPFEDRDALNEDIKGFITKEPSIIHTGLILDVLPYYGLMDIFILPSHREGFPTVVLEASAMEIPVITTKATGCIDAIVNDYTGKFVSSDPQDIKNAMAYYLKNPGIAHQHGLNGRLLMERDYAQELIWTQIEDKVLEL
ncbi:glycosyltransferase family 4 protein [Pedobacter suwonensis]|uniref:glycosyltransferase family 4 protein n=1 Tax=Pedobacter suwonensis TaxID=332999 RepID=UPI002600A062|nr:glycosyltransferase family 4 protein [uncultured Pedobacter sp.]